MDSTKPIVRTIFIVYLAIVSLIGLVMIVISSSQLINMGLKTWVFPAADVPAWLQNCSEPYLYDRPKMVGEEEMTDEEIREQCEEGRAAEIENYKVQKARDAVQHLALLIVAVPLFGVHYHFFDRERKEKKAKKKK